MLPGERLVITSHCRVACTRMNASVLCLVFLQLLSCCFWCLFAWKGLRGVVNEFDDRIERSLKGVKKELAGAIGFKIG